MPPLSNLEVVGDARRHVHTRRAHAYGYIYMHIYIHEVVGDARMEETDKGVIMVVPLRINVNLKSLTMDELQGRRKLLHISMMHNLLAEAHRDLADVDKEAVAAEEVCVCLTCLPYMSALYVRRRQGGRRRRGGACLPYMSALCVCLVCATSTRRPSPPRRCVSALHVCLVCLPCMSAFYACLVYPR